MNEEIEVYKKTLSREKTARKAAENLLEQKSRELFEANERLKQLNSSLEMVVERRTAEWERANTRLSTLIQNLPYGILAVNEKSEIIFVNSRACELFRLNLNPQSLVRESLTEFEKLMKPLVVDSEQFELKKIHLLSQQELKTGERIELIDGRIFEFDFIPIFSEKTSIGHLWQYRDVTADYHVREKLLRMKQEAEETNQRWQSTFEKMRAQIRDILQALSNEIGSNPSSLEQIRRIEEVLRKAFQTDSSFEEALALLEQDSAREVKVDSEIANVAPLYLEKRRKEIQQLKSCLEAGDYSQISRIAQALQESGRAYGFEKLSQFGNLLQLETKSENRKHLQILLEKLEEYLREIILS